MTAQRLVQRMMKDSIHSGRRPSGLCGAALLIAARMHEYSRTAMDIVRIVKIHETTLRKRLIEFGDTPSSSLTLDEFMAVDLEAEQDPPAFKAARKKDRERLQKLPENASEFTELQMEIDAHLEKELKKGPASRKRASATTTATTDEHEGEDTDVFIRESTIDVISDCLQTDPEVTKSVVAAHQERGIRPDIAAMCLPSPPVDANQELAASTSAEQGVVVGGAAAADDDDENNGELNLVDIDDAEIDTYIMTEHEARYKDAMWNKLNADYLREAKVREDRLAKEKEEGKPEKKRRRTVRKRNIGPSNTASEAIEKMLQEKKISNKINYDILKTLTESKVDEMAAAAAVVDETPIYNITKQEDGGGGGEASGSSTLLPSLHSRKKSFLFGE